MLIASCLLMRLVRGKVTSGTGNGNEFPAAWGLGLWKEKGESDRPKVRLMEAKRSGAWTVEGQG